MTIQNAADIDNTFIGKGIVKIKLTGEAVYRDIGEVPEFEFSTNITKLDYFSSRSGVRKKVRTVVTEKSATLRIMMSESTFENLALALMGAGSAEDSPAADQIGILSEDEVRGAVRFVGTNSVGPKIQLDFPDVSFAPSGSFNPISDEWGSLEVTAEVLANTAGSYGTARWNITSEVTS